MSYKKMMKHWNNTKRHKLTKRRIRGNLSVWKTPDEINHLEKEGLIPRPK